MTALLRACRALWRRRAYTALTFGLIVLATTATSATFAVVRATLWRDLPYRDPDALVDIATTEPVNRDSAQQVPSSAIMLSRWRSNSRAFAGVEGYTPIQVSVAGDGAPEALAGGAISAGLFDLLGTPPAVGRSFRREEEVPASGVIVISDAVARRRFGSPAGALGKTLNVDGDPRTVVGVMPAGFSLLFQGGDAWIPLDLSVEQQGRVFLRNIVVSARLRPNISLPQALAELKAIQPEFAAAAPNAYSATGVSVQPLREALFGNRRETMLILASAVGFVLLIAIVNVANLILADVLGRRTATMTRIALGARPSSLIASRLNEAIVLSALAFVVALPLCVTLLAAFTSVSPDAFVPLANRWLDAIVVIVTLAAAVVVGVGGALPAILVEARTKAVAIAGTLAKTSGGDRRLQMTLGAAQSLVTVLLLSMAVLLLRDFARLLSTSTGFVAEDVVVVRLNVASRERATVVARAQYADALVRSVSAVPGVIDVSAAQTRFVLNETMQSSIDVDGFVGTPGQRLFAQIRHVMPHAARVLGVRVLSGRGIDSTDRAEARPVAVVSASFTKRYWPGERAIGKRIRRGAPGSPWLEVVGVVDDVSDAGLGVPIGPTLYVPYLQQNTPTARVTLVARVRTQTSSLVDDVRRAVWAVNSSQAIDDITPLASLMSRSATEPRFRSIVVLVFSISAVALVLAGVYAITLFGAMARRREFGIRAAVGASPANLVMLATRSSLQPVLIGGVAGALLTVPAATLLRRTIQSSADAGDVLLGFGAVAGLLVVAGLTSLVPARRAASVSPTEAIRAE